MPPFFRHRSSHISVAAAAAAPQLLIITCKHSPCVVTTNLVLVSTHLVLENVARVPRILPVIASGATISRARCTRAGHVEKRDDNREGVHRPPSRLGSADQIDRHDRKRRLATTEPWSEQSARIYLSLSKVTVSLNHRSDRETRKRIPIMVKELCLSLSPSLSLLDFQSVLFVFLERSNDFIAELFVPIAGPISQSYSKFSGYAGAKVREREMRRCKEGKKSYADTHARRHAHPREKARSHALTRLETRRRRLLAFGDYSPILYSCAVNVS